MKKIEKAMRSFIGKPPRKGIHIQNQLLHSDPEKVTLTVGVLPDESETFKLGGPCIKERGPLGFLDVDVSIMDSIVRSNLGSCLQGGCKNMEDIDKFKKELLSCINNAQYEDGARIYTFFVTQFPFNEDEITCNNNVVQTILKDSSVIRLPIDNEKTLYFYLSFGEVGSLIARELQIWQNNVLVVYWREQKLAVTLVSRKEGSSSLGIHSSKETCERHIMEALQGYFNSSVDSRRGMMPPPDVKNALKMFGITVPSGIFPAKDVANLEIQILQGIRELKTDITPWIIFVAQPQKDTQNQPLGKLKALQIPSQTGCTSSKDIATVIAEGHQECCSDGILVVSLVANKVALALITSRPWLTGHCSSKEIRVKWKDCNGGQWMESNISKQSVRKHWKD